MIIGVRHTGIVVHNFSQALSFWTSTMGFTVLRQDLEEGPFIDTLVGLEDVFVTTAKLMSPDGLSIIELLNFQSHTSNQFWKGCIYSTGLTHIALNVINLDQFYTTTNKASLTFLSPPTINVDSSAKVAFAKGPEDLLLEFVEILS